MPDPNSPAPGSQDEETPPVTDPLVAAQIKKLNAEADKAAAEADKAAIEAHRLKVFWTPRVILQAVFGGAVTAALIVGWFFGYLKPFVESTALRAEIRASRDSIANDSALAVLTIGQAALGRQRDSLGVLLRGLRVKASEDSARAEAELTTARADVTTGTGVIASLEARLAEATTSAASLQVQGVELTLAGTFWDYGAGGQVYGTYEFYGDGTMSFKRNSDGASLPGDWYIRNDSLIRAPPGGDNLQRAYFLEGRTSFPFGVTLQGQVGSDGTVPLTITRIADPGG